MSVYSFLLKVGGVDVATYGLTVSDLPDHWDAPSQSVEEASIPGREGSTALSTEPILAPRDFTVQGVLAAASASAFEDAIDTLKYVLSASTLTLIGGNRSTRQRTGKFAGMTTSLYSLMAAGTVSIKVHCVNPIAYETSTTNPTGSAASDIACALGTRRSFPVITLTTATNPVVTYKNYAGATVQTMTITGTGTIVIDCDARTVTIGGVRRDSAVTAGDFFALDPRDGDYTLSHSPTVRSSSGSVSIVYNKAWL